MHTVTMSNRDSMRSLQRAKERKQVQTQTQTVVVQQKPKQK